jgi:putative N-acetylmannosamine-6-phosphate epimerase
MMLDDAARAARSGFACMFSTSDEYEAALIAERRAEGRYSSPNYWPVAVFVGCSLTVVGAVLLMF